MFETIHNNMKESTMKENSQDTMKENEMTKSSTDENWKTPEGGASGVMPEGKEGTASGKVARRRTSFGWAAIAAFAVAAAAWWLTRLAVDGFLSGAIDFNAFAPSVVPVCSHRGDESVKAEAYAAVEQCKAEMDKATEAFRASVERKKAGFEEVRKAVPGVAGSFGFKKCNEIAKAGIANSIAEKMNMPLPYDVNEIVLPELGDRFMQPLADARAAEVECLNEYRAALDAAARKCSIRLSNIRNWDPSLGEISKSLEKAWMDISKNVASLVGEKVGLEICAIIEATCVRSCVTTITALLSRAIATGVSSTGVGTAVAMCDSPAPGPMDIVGAAVTAVGFSVTAIQVCKAAKKAPSELSRTLNNAIDNQRDEVVEAVLAEGDKMHERYVDVLGRIEYSAI